MTGSRYIDATAYKTGPQLRVAHSIQFNSLAAATGLNYQDSVKLIFNVM